eukprot:Pompholyxophrys_punicea_v1_NODE_671_length_1479_cov_2.714888.p3 type:complete len:119 gc:universal NODE_671_length_1479_cov_2.714888:1073-717(-)
MPKLKRNLQHKRNYPYMSASSQKEPPLPLYIALKVYSVYRSEKTIDILFKLGLSVSYNRVLDVMDGLAEGVTELISHVHQYCKKTYLLYVVMITSITIPHRQHPMAPFMERPLLRCKI